MEKYVSIKLGSIKNSIIFTLILTIKTNKMKTSNVTIHRGHITWSNFDTPEVESVVVFKVDGVVDCSMSTNGMEFSGDGLDISITDEPIASFNTSSTIASEELIHELFIAYDRTDWLWEL